MRHRSNESLISSLVQTTRRKLGFSYFSADMDETTRRIMLHFLHDEVIDGYGVPAQTVDQITEALADTLKVTTEQAKSQYLPELNESIEWMLKQGLIENAEPQAGDPDNPAYWLTDVGRRCILKTGSRYAPAMNQIVSDHFEEQVAFDQSLQRLKHFLKPPD